MLDCKFVKAIETQGFTNKCGKRVYGTAALLHFLHRRVKDIDSRHVELGKAYVLKHLSA